VGHKLTNAGEHFLTKMDLIHQEIERELSCEFEVLRFLGFGGTPFDVFQQDINVNVASCDMFVAVIDGESTGLGYEMGVAQSRGKPILVIQHRVSHVSRLIIGAVQHNSSTMRHVVVDGPADVVGAIRDSIGWFGLHARRQALMASDHGPESEHGDALVFHPGQGFLELEALAGGEDDSSVRG
jgi:hypothetical protein